MDDIVARILSRLYPDAFAPDDASWQQRRSAHTRVAILEAAIDSLVKLGYSGTSTKTIAEYAGITRGAMSHHYATKLDLISAVIEYVNYKRMELYLAEIAKLTPDERRKPALAMELYNQNSRAREYQSYLEILVATRSDPELRAVFIPKARHFQQVWFSEMQRAFPGWEGKQAELELCSTFATLVNEALLLNGDVIDSAETQEVLKDLTAKVIELVRDGGIRVQLPLVTDAAPAPEGSDAKA